MARQPYLLPATSTDALRVREAAADDFFVNSRCATARRGGMSHVWTIALRYACLANEKQHVLACASQASVMGVQHSVCKHYASCVRMLLREHVLPPF